MGEMEESFSGCTLQIPVIHFVIMQITQKDNLLLNCL